MRLKYGLLAFGFSTYIFCEAVQQTQVFEVTSVKPHVGPMPVGGGKLSFSGSRITVEYYALLALITFAYDVKPYQVSSATALDHTYYDIMADAGDGRPRSKDEFRRLMQALLADRFKLRLHREDKQLPVYSLIAAPKGPKLTPSALGVQSDEPSDPRGNWRLKSARGRAITLSCSQCTLGQLVEFIRGNDGMDRPIIDATGLTGTYPISLTYVPQYRMGGAAESNPEEADIFTAVKDLGLRLQPQTSSIEVLVIDHFEKPSEN